MRVETVSGWMRVARGFVGAALAAAAVFVATPARAQDKEIWTAAMFQAAVDPGPTGFRLWLDLHDRRNAAGSTFIVRPGVGWAVTPWLSVWGGYAWIPQDPDEGDPVSEHRAWEQVVLGHNLGRVAGSLRIRQEQRFRDEEINHRTRALGRVGVKLAGPVSLQVWDEVFFSFNETSWFPYEGYDQNRFFVGPAVEGFKGFRLEAGYLNHDLARGETSANNHIFLMSAAFSIVPEGEGRGGGGKGGKGGK